MLLVYYSLFIPPVIWVVIYTFNFGRWCLKQKNLPGALLVFLLASASMVIPLYMLFFGISLDLDL